MSHQNCWRHNQLEISTGRPYVPVPNKYGTAKVREEKYVNIHFETIELGPNLSLSVALCIPGVWQSSAKLGSVDRVSKVTAYISEPTQFVNIVHSFE